MLSDYRCNTSVLLALKRHFVQDFRWGRRWKSENGKQRIDQNSKFVLWIRSRNIDFSADSTNEKNRDYDLNKTRRMISNQITKIASLSKRGNILWINGRWIMEVWYHVTWNKKDDVFLQNHFYSSIFCICIFISYKTFRVLSHRKEVTWLDIFIDTSISSENRAPEVRIFLSIFLYRLFTWHLYTK